MSKSKRPDPLGDAIRAGGDPLIPWRSLKRVMREHLNGWDHLQGPDSIGPVFPPHDAVGGKERSVQYWRWSTIKGWHDALLAAYQRHLEEQGWGSKKAVKAAKLRRLLAPSANATEGERVNARAALQRMGMRE